jgi:hypothetical protein
VENFIGPFLTAKHSFYSWFFVSRILDFALVAVVVVIVVVVVVLCVTEKEHNISARKRKNIA